MCDTWPLRNTSGHKVATLHKSLRIELGMSLQYMFDCLGMCLVTCSLRAHTKGQTKLICCCTTHLVLLYVTKLVRVHKLSATKLSGFAIVGEGFPITFVN